MHERIAELRNALKGWVPDGCMESVLDYERFTAYGVLPYSGGYREQPAWLLEDFRMIALWMELAALTGKLPKAKPGMKNMNDLLKMG